MRENQKESFRAIYYPYSRILHQSDLKRAILLFDELIFVDPVACDLLSQPAQGPIGGSENAQARFDLDWNAMSFHQGSITEEVFEHQNRYPYRAKGEGSSETYARWYDVRGIYEILQSEGVVSLANSQDVLRPFSEALSFSIIHDLLRSNFVYSNKRKRAKDAYGVTGGPSVIGWQLHQSRLPERLLELLTDRTCLRQCLNTILAGSNWQVEVGDTVERLDWIAEEIDEAREWMEDEILMTPFDFGLLTVVNQALLLAEKFDAYLLTDDALPNQVLRQKFSEIRPLQGGVLPGSNKEPAIVRRFRYQQVVTTVVSRVVPNELLDMLTVEEILEFRRENQKSLGAFRDQMKSLSDRLTSQVHGEHFDQEVEKLVKDEIVPQFRDIDAQLRKSAKKLFRGALSKLGSAVLKGSATALPTLSLATYFGATPGQLVLYSSASLMSGLGLVVPDILEHFAERRELRSNGLTYLMNFAEAANRHQ